MSAAPDQGGEQAESASTGESWSPQAADAAAHQEATFARRPEIFVGAAFAGGLALAAVLRVVGR